MQTDNNDKWGTQLSLGFLNAEVKEKIKIKFKNNCFTAVEEKKMSRPGASEEVWIVPVEQFGNTIEK